MTTTLLRRRLCELCMVKTSYSRNEILTRSYSGTKLKNKEVRQKRNEIFEKEKERQKGFIKRIEKIEVKYEGLPENMSMVMNKDLSTPYHCAMHVGDIFMKRSVVALVNDQLWDMHKPLTKDCTLKLLHMLDEDPKDQNKIFWRSCSFVLGCVLESAFKDDTYVELCSFPSTRVESGSFMYDVDFKLPDWKPTYMELNTLSLEAMTLLGQKLDFERLEVNVDLAMEMFEDNRFKTAQIPYIAAADSQGRVTVYRIGNHVDISQGPLIANTSQIGRFTITKMFNLNTEKYGALTRVQGMAIPAAGDVHDYVYQFLCKEAARKNTDGLHLYKLEKDTLEKDTDSEKQNISNAL